jgi:hypothetical protein
MAAIKRMDVRQRFNGYLPLCGDLAYRWPGFVCGFGDRTPFFE